jgi:hypothetical protein
MAAAGRVTITATMSDDREWQPEDETGAGGVERPADEDVQPVDEDVEPADEDVQPVDQDVEPADEDVEPYPLEGARAAPAPGSGSQRGRGGETSEQDRWRRFGWVALIILTIGVAWALILSTILIDRSGDRTADLISLFEQSQEARNSALGQVPLSQEERRAAIEGQRQQTRTAQAEAQAARANQAQGQAAARQAQAGAGLAGARSRQADAEAALAQAQANRASTQPSSLERQLALDRQVSLDAQVALARQAALDQQQIDLLKKLNASVRALREAIKDLRPGPPGP